MQDKWVFLTIIRKENTPIQRQYYILEVEVNGNKQPFTATESHHVSLDRQDKDEIYKQAAKLEKLLRFLGFRVISSYKEYIIGE